MIRNFFLFMVSCTVCAACVFPGGFVEGGNGTVVTTERPVSAQFTHVDLGTSGIVRVHQSDEHRITISIDTNLEQFIVTEISGGKLKIKTKTWTSLRPTSFVIDVYMPEPRRFSVSGSGDIVFADTLDADSLWLEVSGSGEIEGAAKAASLTVEISGSGEIKGEVEAASLSAKISGSGEMALTGTAGNLNLEISGSGSARCKELESGDASVRISGSGRAEINAVNTLDANVSGSGNVLYRGNPRITFNGSGSGSLRAIN